VRKGAYIGPNVELGNYAEVKNSNIGAGTKSHHFSYLGDADVGEKVNIGAGSITANYDGAKKHRTRIGKGAFIGSDTIMRAPVTIGEGAFTGAASLVTRDVPDGEMALGVPARIRERRPKAEENAPAESVTTPDGPDRTRTEDAPNH
jgi:bifunctional UDP-N-acetylglucosamine pyrophosphorylase/glucosamine-1-phosphate N-acetyltransferase